MVKFWIGIAILTLLCAGIPAKVYAQGSGPLILNEIMSLDTKTLKDEDGEFTDWIEIRNTGAVFLPLGGYGLTDDPEEPGKWVFPNVTLAPDGYLVVFASGKNRTTLSGKWETVITLADQWRYLAVGAEVAGDWKALTFDDSSWNTGISGIGTSTMTVSCGTVVPGNPTTLYMRKKFIAADPNAILHALLHIDYDDAFVAYLNGHEIARANIGTPGIPPAFDARAGSSISPVYYSGKKPPEFSIPGISSLLAPGENVLAIEIHAFKEFYPVLGIPFLSLEMTSLPTQPRGTPLRLALVDSVRCLHSNFKIGASGETLALSAPDGAVSDSVSVGMLNADISLGRGANGAWMLYNRPTPGKPNGEGYFGSSTAAVTASLPNGFYAGPQVVMLSTGPPGAKIRYTLDGSVPKETSREYTQPVSIDTTCVVRASVFETGFLPGPMLTMTYFIAEPSTTIPVVSLTFDPPDLWDPNIGIYVQGNSKKFGGYPIAPRTPAANWNEDWERAVHVEFFESNGTLGFEADAGGAICGSANRVLPQKSLEIHFRGDYGMDELSYPLFPGNKVTRFKTFRLRNAGNDWMSSNIRDYFHQELLKPLNIEKQDNRPVHVYINGEYWGIQIMQEAIDEDYLASHLDEDPDKIDIIDDFHIAVMNEPRSEWFTGYTAAGNDDKWIEMLEYISANDLADSAHYAHVNTLLDVDNYIDFLICRIFIADPDGNGHNAKYWRPETPDGRFRMLLYDTDCGSGFDLFGEPGPAYKANMINYYFRPYQLARSPEADFIALNLKKNAEFRNAFVNRYADLLNTLFAKDAVTPVLQKVKAVVQPEIGRHIQRWKGTSNGKITSVQDWLTKVSVMEQFAQLRTQYEWANIIKEFGLAGQATVTIVNAKPAGGMVMLNSLTITDPSWNGIYFKGAPVHLSAIPNPGFRFEGWDGAITGSSPSVELNLTGNASVTASFVVDNSARNVIQFNEINYQATSANTAGDWVELTSTYTVPMNLTGWSFRDSDSTRAFVFPGGTVIAPGGYLVLCRDTGEFAVAFPTVKNYLGGFNFGLSSDGEFIGLYDSRGALADSLSFGIEPPWPAIPAGSGTLELKEVSLDNSLPGNWEDSGNTGTPGIANDLVLAVEDDAAKPQTFALGRNYPNPFNPVTTIPFDLPEESEVVLQVFNSLGQLVATLVNVRLSAGAHTAVFDASDLPSGVLFFHIQAGKHAAVGKMLLMK